MSKANDLAEVRFERYLGERGYGFEHEPDLGNGKRPDYLVRTNHGEVVCEVKSFNTVGSFGSSRVGVVQVGARSQKKVLKPIRSQISEAAKQLKGISGRPLVVVLANPQACPVPLDSFSVMAAMYGDVVIEFPVSAEGIGGDAIGTTGLNRKLRVVDPDSGEWVGGDHGYISAVVVLRLEDLAFKDWSHRWRDRHHRASFADAATEAVAFFKAASAGAVPHSDDVFMDIFETFSDQAVPLPRDVFNGPHDRRWIPDNTRTALVRL